ncbi:MAG: UxaA family hydrolase [Proteobacteria bacterium]|jgi:hypothetical protein|nr:UxaA family hydrolase [Pseudomonadota bacterium]
MNTSSPLSGIRLSLKTKDRDNVATMFDDKLELTLIDEGVTVDKGIPFGHKVAVVCIAKGEAIRKYGVVIGHAKVDIRIGEHVHVHNIE